MRILTHNMLVCNSRECNMRGFPLKIVPVKVDTEESEFTPEFISHMLPKIDWAGVLSAAADLNIPGLPATVPADAMQNVEFQRNVHHLLLNIRVIDAKLCCPNCSREYPVHDGIPNMLLNEDEV